MLAEIGVGFVLVTVGFIIVSVTMVLVILVQRPQGGGLASAFGGAGGSGADTVFGGRVGDALTNATVIIFVLFISVAIWLNLMDNVPDNGGTTDTTVAGLADDDTSAGTTPTGLPTIPPGELDTDSDPGDGDEAGQAGDDAGGEEADDEAGDETDTGGDDDTDEEGAGDGSGADDSEGEDGNGR